MKKPIIRWSIAVVVAVLLFLVVPQFFARDLQEESARNLAALWLVAYPVFSVIGGIVAGWFIQDMWPYPILVPILFLTGVWITIGPPVPSTWFQAASYLGFGVIAMLVTALIRYRRAHKDPLEFRFRH